MQIRTEPGIARALLVMAGSLNGPPKGSIPSSPLGIDASTRSDVTGAAVGSVMGMPVLPVIVAERISNV